MHTMSTSHVVLVVVDDDEDDVLVAATANVTPTTSCEDAMWRDGMW